MFRNLSSFWGTDDPYSYYDLVLNLTEKQYTTKNLNVESRWINYWDSNGLLLSESSDGKWRKFSYIDYFWMEVLWELRSFGVPAKVIEPIREDMIRRVSFQELFGFANKFASSEEVSSKLDPKDREEFKRYWDSPEDVPELANESIEFLTMLILSAIIQKSQAGLLIRQNGDSLAYSEIMFGSELDYPEFEEIRNIYREFRSHSHLYISFTDIIINSIQNEKINSQSSRLAILTEDEYEVLNLIRKKNLKSLKIRFAKGEINLLEATEMQKVEPEARFLDVIMKMGYQNISFVTENGKIVSFENTRKIKPKKKK